MYALVSTCPSAPAQCRDSSPILRTPTAVWEGRKEYLQLRLRITGCCRYTRSSMATGVSRDWYRTRLCLRLWIPVESGQLHAAWREISRRTKAISPIAISPAETILMGAAI